MSEKAILSHKAGRHLILNFALNRVNLGLGDEVGGCFSVDLVKYREVIINLFSKFQLRHEGFSFYVLR